MQNGKGNNVIQKKSFGENLGTCLKGISKHITSTQSLGERRILKILILFSSQCHKLQMQ